MHELTTAAILAAPFNASGLAAVAFLGAAMLFDKETWKRNRGCADLLLIAVVVVAIWVVARAACRPNKPERDRWQNATPTSTWQGGAG